jgi:SAM-dependent methyltransferase
MSKSPRIAPAPDAIQHSRDLRYEVSRAHLRGCGIEIGAGEKPQRLPEGVIAEIFDKRDPGDLAKMFEAPIDEMPHASPMEAIRARFPNGADFLIAHQVLEHIADPIGALLEWSRLVRDGGVLVVGVPHPDYCPDKGRVVPDLEHLLLDHLLERNHRSFESREHAYSCIFGWMNWWDDWAKLDKQGASERAHGIAHMPELETHFHCFPPDLFHQLWESAAIFSDRHWEILRIATPDREPPDKTFGDILYVFGVTDTPGGRESEAAATRAEIAGVREKLARALKTLHGIGV